MFNCLPVLLRILETCLLKFNVRPALILFKISVILITTVAKWHRTGIILAPLLCYSKLCASFRIHWCIQTWDTVRKRPIWVKFDDFFSRVTLKFDEWPWKTIGHLFNTTSSFVHHFVPIGEIKLELQSGNAQSGSNSTIFRAVWPWNLTDDLEKQ